MTPASEIFTSAATGRIIVVPHAYVLNNLLERTEDKQYLITTSFNRNGFVFEK